MHDWRTRLDGGSLQDLDAPPERWPLPPGKGGAETTDLPQAVSPSGVALFGPLDRLTIS